MLAALALGLGLAAAPGVAVLHNGPPAFLQVRVQERGTGLDANLGLELVLTGEQALLGEWFGSPGRPGEGLSEAQRAELLAGAREQLGQVFELAVDGQAAAPQVLGLTAFSATSGFFGLEPAYELRLELPLERAPERLDVVWRRFPTYVPEREAPAELTPEAGGRRETITLEITSLEGVFDLVTLHRGEPAYTWHVPPAPLPVELLPTELGARPGEPGRAGLLLGAGLVAALLARAGLRRAGRRGLGAAAAGLLLAGGAAAGWQVYSGPAVPEGPAALELFERLHTNLYRAFDGSTREEVYDLLAQSVDGPILDAMYGDLYEGLILREEGGAVAQVEAVERLAGELDPELTASLQERGEPGFGVRWTWRVTGRVVHFAHEHRRVERLEARYSVRATPAGWRIAGVEVLAQEREE